MRKLAIAGITAAVLMGSAGVLGEGQSDGASNAEVQLGGIRGPAVLEVAWLDQVWGTWVVRLIRAVGVHGFEMVNTAVKAVLDGDSWEEVEPKLMEIYGKMVEARRDVLARYGEVAAEAMTAYEKAMQDSLFGESPMMTK